MNKEEIDILYDFVNNENTFYCNDWQGFDYETILPLINKMINYNKNLQYKLEEKDKVIDKAINYAKNTTVAEHGSEEIFNISELWFVKELLEILERGKK